MSTSVVILDTSQYVLISASPGSFLLQSHGDTVRIAFSNVKPAVDNRAFHELGGQSGYETMMQTPYVETNMWALAISIKSRLTITGDFGSKAILTDRNNRDSMVSMVGETNVGFNIDDISINFQYSASISTYDIKSGGVVTGTGSTGSDGSTATISTGAGVGDAVLESVNAVRYRAGHEIHGAMSIVFGTPEIGVNQYAGFLNSVDGWCVGYQGDDFGLWFISDSNINFISQSNFNLDRLDGTGSSKYNIDPTKGQVYRLTYVWHGFLDLVAEVRTTDGRWVPFHKLAFVNLVTTTHLSNPNLPMAVKVERTSGTGSDVTLKTGSWRGGVTGSPRTSSPADRWFSYTALGTTLTADGTTRNNVFTFYNKPAFQGNVNHITVEFGILSLSSELNKTVAYYGTKNATITGGSTFTDIDSVNSVIQVSAGGTLSGGGQGPASVIAPGAERRTDLRGTGILLHPGEYLSLEAVVPTGGTGDFSASMRFVEYH